MEQKHRKAIQSNFKSLVERTDLHAVVTSLYEKGVFSEQMIEIYRAENIPERDRKRELYRRIPQRGPEAFGHLVDTLHELGLWDLVADLDPDNPFSMNGFNRGVKQKPTDDFVSLRNKNRTNAESQQSTAPPPPAVPAPASFASLSPDLEPCTTTVPKLEVIKSTKFVEQDASKDLKLYKTRGPHRGVLVVFSYMCFENNIEDDRPGVDVDRDRLKDLFLEIGFRVLSYPNLSYQQTLSTLESMKDVLVDVESVFIVVSSHGYQRLGTTDTDIRCSDGKLIAFSEIVSYFNNSNLPRLIGVPKVLIFQICRGSSVDFVRRLPNLGEDVQTDGSGRDESDASLTRPGPVCDKPNKFPLYSDILIAHSTLPGCVSFRDTKNGSWYIQILCEVFAAHAHNTHVDELFTLVDQRMRERYRLQTSSVDRWGFNKRLYLHPGLFE